MGSPFLSMYGTNSVNLMNVNLIIEQVILLQGFFSPSQIQMLLLYIVVNSVKNCNHENKNDYFKAP